MIDLAENQEQCHYHSSNEFSIQGSTMTVYPGIHNDIQVCI